VWSAALAVVGTVVAISAWALLGRRGRRTARTHAQFTAKDVETALDEVLNPGYQGTFEEFLVWPINDQYLESIRQECLRICHECPSARYVNAEGEKRIAALLRELRQRTHLAGGSTGSHSDA
jgi:type II secretory pathway pseudopilin PulG